MTGAIAGVAFLAGAAFGPWVAVVIASVMTLIRLVDSDRHRLAWAVTAVAVAALLGAWRGEDGRAANMAIEPIPGWIDSANAVRGTVMTAPTNDGQWQNFAVHVTESNDDINWMPVSGRVCVTSGAVPIVGLGDALWLTGTMTATADQEARYRPVSRVHGCAANLFARAFSVDRAGRGWRRRVADARADLSRSLLRAAPGDTGALLSGLVTGDDHALSARRYRSFTRTGTTHITAVSGSNLALIVGTATTVGGLAGLRRRLAWQVATLVTIWSYALLVGLQPPVARAALVATGVAVALRLGRRPDPVPLVMIAGAILVAVDPPVLWTLSFQLSFAASLALSAVLPHLHPAGLVGWMRAGLTVAVVAQVATLPVQSSHWGTFSLASLPANVLIGPLVAVAFPVAAIAAPIGLISPLIGDAVAAPAAYLARAIFVVVDTLGGSDRSVASLGAVPQLAGISTYAASVILLVATCAEGRRWTRRMRQAVPAGLMLGAFTAAAALIVIGRISHQWR